MTSFMQKDESRKGNGSRPASTGNTEKNIKTAGYEAAARYEQGQISDIVIRCRQATRHLAGRGGVEAEKSRILSIPETGVLPVFIGSGLGEGVRTFLSQRGGPVAVIDKEWPILEQTGCFEDLASSRNILWLSDDDPESVLHTLTGWQWDHQGLPFHPVLHPFYFRIDPDYYRPIHDQLQASKQYDFWSRVRYKKFVSGNPRPLLLTSKYFLMGELTAACDRMNVPYQLIDIGDKETGRADFVEKLLKAVIDFKPDCILTINHLGVDREGVLMDLLDRLQIPLASWFVDNPRLVLSCFPKVVSPWTAIFTWDADNLDDMCNLGFEHVHFLPLATDHTRFHPGKKGGGEHHPWRSVVSFVGNSMLYKVASRMKRGKFPRELLRVYKEIATGFSKSDHRCVETYLRRYHPDLRGYFDGLKSHEQRMAYETLITWESTRQYRKACVEQTLEFDPLIIGDQGWKITFKDRSSNWRYHPEVSYYDDLPRLYPLADINFNCTSMQMKGAVNQRVFDVPSAGGFLLTDYRKQMESLFEPGREIVFYQEPKEIPELIRFYEKHPSSRREIVNQARKRVLREHTYEHRLHSLFASLKEIYG